MSLTSKSESSSRVVAFSAIDALEARIPYWALMSMVKVGVPETLGAVTDKTAREPRMSMLDVPTVSPEAMVVVMYWLMMGS